MHKHVSLWIKYSYEGELDEDSTDSKLRPGILCNLFRAFSNRALSSRALAENFIFNIKRMKDLAQSNWVSETCRNIQVQVIKTTAFNNRLALKSSFGMDYHKLFPGSIFNSPSYTENFISSSSEGWPIYLY